MKIPDRSKTWFEATRYCENLTLGGFNNWRLPNINELYSIVDYSSIQPAIDSPFLYLANSRDRVYWSSTSVVPSLGTLEYAVDFDKGSVYSFAGSRYSEHVRCVRSTLDIATEIVKIFKEKSFTLPLKKPYEKMNVKFLPKFSASVDSSLGNYQFEGKNMEDFIKGGWFVFKIKIGNDTFKFRYLYKDNSGYIFLEKRSIDGNQNGEYTLVKVIANGN